MKRRVLFAVVLILIAASLAAAGKVRPAAVAGSFYPADARELASAVDQMLAQAAVPSLEEPPVAIVAPHAGYIYSGAVAAHSYALLKGRKFSRVIVIAPSHYESFPFVSVYDGSAYATPLGQIPVDEEFAARLASKNLIRRSSRGHAVTSEFREHSLEVQLPFLQRALGSPFQLVPIIMGDQSYESCRALGIALARLIRAPGTLIVASSDLSHYHTYDDAVRLDRSTLHAIEDWDYLSASENFERRVWEACGGGPIVAAMIAAERLGATRARAIKYANSGDTTGDRRRVVGYGSVALYRAPAAGKEQAFLLTPAQKQELLRIARKAVETVVREGQPYQVAGAAPELMLERGAFVTLKKRGELRGCIGYTSPLKPLAITVRDVATLAAVRDDRFPPVAAAELPALEYEISVLSPLRRVSDVRQIRIGQHGLLLKRGGQSGLLLPQVPVEQNWDRATFLEQLCRKAGLAPKSWMAEDADLFAFTALVFGEERAQPQAMPGDDLPARRQAPRRPAPGSPAP